MRPMLPMGSSLRKSGFSFLVNQRAPSGPVVMATTECRRTAEFGAASRCSHTISRSSVKMCTAPVCGVTRPIPPGAVKYTLPSGPAVSFVAPRAQGSALSSVSKGIRVTTPEG